MGVTPTGSPAGPFPAASPMRTSSCASASTKVSASSSASLANHQRIWTDNPNRRAARCAADLQAAPWRGWLRLGFCAVVALGWRLDLVVLQEHRAGGFLDADAD